MFQSKLQTLFLILTLGISNCLPFLSNNLRNLEEAPERQRSSGIVMHISSLPSKFGIGTLGKEAFKFVDFLVNAKQKNWQMLPLGPAEDLGCPYCAKSSYAGNPYFVDLEILVEEKLLELGEASSVFWGKDPSKVDFRILLEKRMKVLEKAFKRFKPDGNYEKFVQENKKWLDDYALYMALKEKFLDASWIEWPEDIRKRTKTALKTYTQELKNRIDLHKFVQFKFYEQFNKLKNYCREKNIKLIGDVPIYVPLDSVDVWASPEIFQLDAELQPIYVSGVPPDAFTADGQRWGNPLYNWDKMKQNNYQWYVDRLGAAGKLFDAIKIDHFRGLESYYAIPASEATARNGKWIKGPDMALINAIKQNLPHIEFIVEDLGFLSREVYELKKNSGFPGMNVLEFAFDGDNSIYLPHNYIRNSVCYAGTHDNEILNKWSKDLPQYSRERAERYLNLPKNANLRKPILRAGMASVSYLFLAQIQDWLGCAGEARMNKPGIVDDTNWVWRAKPGQINDKLAWEIAELTQLYGRW